jgi:hypothetical protein
MKLGIELQNTPVITVEGWKCLQALRPDSVKIRPYHVPLLSEMEERLDARHLLLRPDADGPFDPIQREDELGDAWNAAVNLGFEVIIEPDNEPNHPLHPWVNNPAAWHAAMITFMHNWLLPGELIAPALAVPWDESLYRPALRDALYWDGYGLHLYWQGEAGFEDFYMNRLRTAARPIVVTEMGDSSDDDWVTKLPRYKTALTRCYDVNVDTAYLFILRGGTAEWDKFAPPEDVCGALRRHVNALHRVDQPEDVMSTRPQQERDRLVHCSNVAAAWARVVKQRANVASGTGYGIIDTLGDRMAAELEAIAADMWKMSNE